MPYIIFHPAEKRPSSDLLEAVFPECIDAVFGKSADSSLKSSIEATTLLIKN